jgi:hypothetical protein
MHLILKMNMLDPLEAFWLFCNFRYWNSLFRALSEVQHGKLEKRMFPVVMARRFWWLR